MAIEKKTVLHPRPTIAELEKILSADQEPPIEILPDGTVVAGEAKPLRIARPSGPTYY